MRAKVFIWNRSCQELVEPCGFISLVTSLVSKKHQHGLPTPETGRDFLRRGNRGLTFEGNCGITVKTHYFFISISPQNSSVICHCQNQGKPEVFTLCLLLPLPLSTFEGKALFISFCLAVIECSFTVKIQKNILKIQKNRKGNKSTTKTPSHLESLQPFLYV